MSNYVDPMTSKWPLYERPLRKQFARMDLPPEKMRFVMLVTRDAYLKCAPSLVALPECPPEIIDYIAGLTLRLLGQVAHGAAANYDMSAAAAEAYGAVLTERSGPIEASPPNLPKGAS